MALQSSGQISASQLRTEFNQSGEISLGSLYKGGSIVEGGETRSLEYTQVYGYNGSPSLGTRNLSNVSSFSFSWHNRSISGTYDGWGTSHVRETDEVSNQRCVATNVYMGQMGWRWTAGYSGYTQNPYYFTVVITGPHRTSTTGSFLSGTQYYTGSVTRDQQSVGIAAFTRRSGDPGVPNSQSVATGSTTAVESNLYYIYDLIDCDVTWYFNSYQPGTSSASFSFVFANDVNVNINVPTSGQIKFSDFYGSENVL